MKIIKKQAEIVAIFYYGSDKFIDYRCPTCGMGVADDYVACPYCGQRLKFSTDTTGMDFITYKYKEGSVEDIINKILN